MPHTSFRLTLIPALTLFGCFAVYILVLPAICSAQEQKRLVSFYPIKQLGPQVADTNGVLVRSDIEALEITEIRVEGKSIKVGEPFDAGNDWLGTLTLRVKNVSDKPISSIRQHFSLPEAVVQGETAGFSLEYGRAPSTGTDYGEQPAIMPGDEVTIVRNAAHYERDRQGIEKWSGRSSFNRLILGSTQVIFVDGGKWMRGEPRIASNSMRNVN